MFVTCLDRTIVVFKMTIREESVIAISSEQCGKRNIPFINLYLYYHCSPISPPVLITTMSTHLVMIFILSI